MATNLHIDDQVMAEALKLGGLRTKRETVLAALKEFIARRRQPKALDLEGKIEYDPDYDYKHERMRA